MNVALFNLLGLPRLGGFFSKDYILEFFHYSNIRWLMTGIIYANVYFTYVYTLKLFTLQINSNNLPPYMGINVFPGFKFSLLFFLRVIRVVYV